MDDRRIIDLFWARAEQAIEALSQVYGRRLLHIAINILGDHQAAEEAVSDTYLALWNTIPPASPNPLGAFVYRIGRNTALKHLRTRTAQKRNSQYDLALEELSQFLSGETLEDALDARLLGQAIDRFLDTLSRENRIIFVRRYWFGDSIQEIATQLRLSESATTVRLHRLRNQLRTYLIQEGFSL